METVAWTQPSYSPLWLRRKWCVSGSGRTRTMSSAKTTSPSSGCRMRFQLVGSYPHASPQFNGCWKFVDSSRIGVTSLAFKHGHEKIRPFQPFCDRCGIACSEGKRSQPSCCYILHHSCPQAGNCFGGGNPGHRRMCSWGSASSTKDHWKFTGNGLGFAMVMVSCFVVSFRTWSWSLSSTHEPNLRGA